MHPFGWLGVGALSTLGAVLGSRWKMPRLAVGLLWLVAGVTFTVAVRRLIAMV